MSYLVNDKRSHNEWITVNNLEQTLADVQFSRDQRDVVDLKGSPYSPLEMQLTPLIQYNRLTKYSRVRISQNSINYIMLDEQPDTHDCSSLVVSHKIESSENSENLYLRNTCLFPKFRGLISICLLMFSPMAELR